MFGHVWKPSMICILLPSSNLIHSAACFRHVWLCFLNASLKKNNFSDQIRVFSTQYAWQLVEISRHILRRFMIQNVAFACLCMFSKDGVHSLSKPPSEAEVLAAAAKTNTLTPYPLWDRAAAKTPTPLPPSPKPTPRHSKPPFKTAIQNL